VRIFSVVPSLDTPVCDAQTKRFNEEAAKLPGVEIYTVSMDLPFARSAGAGISASTRSRCYPIIESAPSASTTER
jgi:thiol peroxidase